MKNNKFFSALFANKNIKMEVCMNKKVFYIISILLIIIIFIFCLSSETFCADPKIITKLNTAFTKIKDWILKLATPAAAVAVGTGVFMKKFSFGDEDRLRTGKKLIKSTLYSYGFILAIDLILAAIKALVG